MIDVNKKVRLAIMQALDAKIEIDGQVIRCYHEENFNEDETLYIILATQTEEDVPNKGAFFTTGTILIDCIHKSDGTTFSTVDDLASDVMNTLQPTPQTHGLTSPVDLQIWSVRKLSSQSIPLFSNEGNTMRRLLRYEYKVKEL